MKYLIIDQRIWRLPRRFRKMLRRLAGPRCTGNVGPLWFGVAETRPGQPQLLPSELSTWLPGRALLPRNYLNVKREAFDRWLISLLSPQVERRWRAQFLDFRIVAAGLRSASSGRERNTRPPADCWWEPTRPVQGAQETCWHSLLRLYVAVQQSYAASRALPYYTAVFDPAVTDFYGWMIPKDDMLLVGAAIPPAPMFCPDLSG